jgi:glutaredoxin
VPFAWLRRLIGAGPPPALDHVEVVVYTRRGCHLCEVAWEQLRAEQRRHGFRLGAVDVDGDPELVRAHGEWVPVVTVNGRVRFRGRVNGVLLARLLRAKARRPGQRGGEAGP